MSKQKLTNEATAQAIYTDETYRKVLDAHFEISPYIHQGNFDGFNFETYIPFELDMLKDSGDALKKKIWGQFDRYYGLMFRTAQEHYINKLTEPLKIKKSDYILDVGCGIGSSAIYLAQKYGCRVMAIDISDANIQTAREKIKKMNMEHLVEAQTMDAAKMDYPENTFDHAYSIECFYFIPDKISTLERLKFALKPGGQFAISDYTVDEKKKGFLTQVAAHMFGSLNITHPDNYKPLFEQTKYSNVRFDNVTSKTLLPSMELFKLEKFRSFQEELSALGGKFIGMLTPFIYGSIALPRIRKGKIGLHYIYSQKPV